MLLGSMDVLSQCDEYWWEHRSHPAKILKVVFLLLMFWTEMFQESTSTLRSSFLPSLLKAVPRSPVSSWQSHRCAQKLVSRAETKHSETRSGQQGFSRRHWRDTWTKLLPWHVLNLNLPWPNFAQSLPHAECTSSHRPGDSCFWPHKGVTWQGMSPHAREPEGYAFAWC